MDHHDVYRLYQVDHDGGGEYRESTILDVPSRANEMPGASGFKAMRGERDVASTWHPPRGMGDTSTLPLKTPKALIPHYGGGEYRQFLILDVPSPSHDMPEASGFGAMRGGRDDVYQLYQVDHDGGGKYQESPILDVRSYANDMPGASGFGTMQGGRDVASMWNPPRGISAESTLPLKPQALIPRHDGGSEHREYPILDVPSGANGMPGASGFGAMWGGSNIASAWQPLHGMDVRSTRPLKTPKGPIPRRCKDCRGTFKSSFALNQHRLEVCSIPVRLRPKNCPHPQCNRTFPKFVFLKEHLQTSHPSILFVCTECCVPFGNKDALMDHSRIHPQEFPHYCPVCSKNFANEVDLKSHIKAHESKKNRCDQCGIKFSTIQAVQKHKLSHKKPFPCPNCGKCFKRYDSMQMHLKTHSQ